MTGLEMLIFVHTRDESTAAQPTSLAFVRKTVVTVQVFGLVIFIVAAWTR